MSSESAISPPPVTVHPTYTVTPEAYQVGPPALKPGGVPGADVKDVEDKKPLRELGEIDPASLIPGKGPGGVPQQYFNLEFDDCFEEHQKTRTFSSLYKALGLIYNYIKITIYHIFVIILGIPLMLVFAIGNGIVAFVLVWVWGPVLRVIIVVVYSVAPAIYIPVQAVFAPIVDVSARIFRQIVVQAKLSGSVDLSKQEHVA